MFDRNPSDTGRVAADQRGLRLLHRARSLRGLSPAQVNRIASRLQSSPASHPRRRLIAALAGVALLLSAATALAWATGALERWPRLGRSLRSEPPEPPSEGPRTRRPLRAVAESKLPEEPSPVRPTPVATPARRVPSGVFQPRPAPAENPIVEEGRSFAELLRLWRQKHDGAAALVGLDAHDRRFAAGQMALESRLLRAEILIAQRRGREALAVLDDLALDAVAVPRGRELLVVRGELRTEAGRCREARLDLASIAAGSDSLAMRARNALTHCP